MRLKLFRVRLHRSIRTPFLISYLQAAISGFLAFVFYLQLPPTIPLFYTLAEPIDQLTSKEWIFLFPILATTIAVIHTLFLPLFTEDEKVTTKLFAWSTTIIQFVLMLSLIRILLLVL